MSMHAAMDLVEPDVHFDREWDLDILGNWESITVGGTAENRTHNDVNEIAAIDSSSFTHDPAGNLRQQPLASATRTYTHDAWNRLVKIEEDAGSGDVTIAEYQYNGLHQRVVKRTNTDAFGSLDQQQFFYYNASWQLCEEEVWKSWSTGEDAGDIDQQRHYVWGIRYIDDIIMTREDVNGDGDYSDTNDNDVDWYHITDVQFSTVAMIDSTAKMYERIAYSPYGQAEHFWMGDCVWDSGQSSYRERDIDDDREIQWLSIADNGNPVEIDHADYNVDADVNRDGQITSADWAAATSDNPYGGFSPQYRNPLAAGQLSYFENQIGYDGYIFNEEVEQYCVRFRTYDPELGRWLERDPAGFMDGANLFEYVGSQPILAEDPYGLQAAARRMPRQVRRMVEPPTPSMRRRGIKTGRGTKYPLHAKPWLEQVPWWEWYIPPKPPAGFREIPIAYSPDPSRVVAPMYVPIGTAPVATRAPEPIPVPGTPEYGKLPRKVRAPGDNSPECRKLNADFKKHCKEHGVKLTCNDIEGKLPDVTNREWCDLVRSRLERARTCCELRIQRWKHNCHPLDQVHVDEMWNQCTKHVPKCERVHEECLKRCVGTGPSPKPPWDLY